LNQGAADAAAGQASPSATRHAGWSKDGGPSLPPSRFISIDQNSTPLWDTVPKVAALAGHGFDGTHFIEDVDVAFTRRGAVPGDERVEVLPERCYRGGVSDWGAALFYTDFLGRNPLDARQLEPYTGLTTKALARALELSVDELYDLVSGSDNWQMVGASYVDGPDRHRTLGDLRVQTLKPCLDTLLTHAERNLCEAFPHSDSQRRSRDWFREERMALDSLLRDGGAGGVPEVYRAWMRRHVPHGWSFDLTSRLFDIASEAVRDDPLHALFLERYEDAARLYNAAIAESGVSVAPLATDRGELPLFAVFNRGGHQYRTPLARDGGWVKAGDQAWRLERSAGGALTFPYDALREAGVTALSGKALILVLQAVRCAAGAPLVIPHRGSVYMPGARRLAASLRDAGLLSLPDWPVFRVRFGFLDALRTLAVPVRLPAYLHPFLPAPEISARELAEAVPPLVERAQEELRALTDEAGREQVFRRHLPALAEELADKEGRQRAAARDPATRPLASRLWDEVKALRRQRTRWLLDRAVGLLHAGDTGYFDSRGALLPWSLALGGRPFYEQVLGQARLYRDGEAPHP